MQSIFRIGFQQLLDARFQNATELIARLERMSDHPQDFDEDEFRREKEALDELLASHAWRVRDEAARVLEAGAKAFMVVFSERISSAGLAYGGAGPNLTDGGRGNEFYFFIVRPGTSSPKVSFRHEMRISDRRIGARVQIEMGEWDDYYSGHPSDLEGLEVATSNKAKMVVTMLIRALRAQLAL